MNVNLQQELLLNRLKVAGRILTNKRIALLDDNFLRVIQKNGAMYLISAGAGHCLMQEVVPSSEDRNEEQEPKELCIAYSKFLAPVSELSEEVTISMHAESLKVESGTIQVSFNGYQGETLLGLLHEMQGRLHKVKTEGVKLARREFVDTLTYLHGLRDKEAEGDLQDVYITPEKSFVATKRFAVRMDYSVPVGFGVNRDTSDVLMHLLGMSEEEEFHIMLEGNTLYVAVGNDLYQTNSVNTQIKKVNDLFQTFNEDVSFPMVKSEFVRFVRLATFFTESDEDILLTVREGKGSIQSDGDGGNGGASNGTFAVPENVQDLEITVNGDDVLTVFSGLGSGAGQEIDLKLSLDAELGYFRHNKGDCILSIRNLEM